MKKTCPSSLEVQYFGEKRRGGHYTSKHKNGKQWQTVQKGRQMCYGIRGEGEFIS